MPHSKKKSENANRNTGDERRRPALRKRRSDSGNKAELDNRDIMKTRNKSLKMKKMTYIQINQQRRHSQEGNT